METLCVSRLYKRITICVIFLCFGLMIMKIMLVKDNDLRYVPEEVTKLKDRITELENLLLAKSKQERGVLNRAIPESRHLGRELNSVEARARMSKSSTVLMFSSDEGASCFQARIENVQKEYPGIKIIVASKSKFDIPIAQNTEYLPNIDKEGQALATMVAKINTPYFLYLSPGVQLPPHDSDISASWLLHALEKVAELDFVGGSFLCYQSGVKYPVLEVPCHRLRMCNWTMSQTFEYRYSVDDMMVCEETSSSFMGRINSLSKVGQFDPKLDTMATTDFFWRAKGNAVIGLRPEVQFIVSKLCFPSPLSTAQEADMKFAFMKKYELFIVRNSFKHEVKAVDSKYFSTLNDYGMVFWKQGTYASPMYARGLLFNLEIAADFLESKNISYFLDSGVPLGGIKTGGLLPWDRDIDLGFFAGWQQVLEGLKQHCTEKGVTAIVTAEPIQGGRKEIFLRAVGDFGYNTMYQQPENVREEHSMMYVYIHGRKYPVKTYLFSTFRASYGLHYLEMHGEDGRLNCHFKGHHACVPEQFKYGAGHWREYYCDL